MMMVLLQSPEGDQVRVPQADSYPAYEGWTVGTPEDWPTLAMLQADAWAQVKALRDQHKAAGCTVPNLGVVQTDDTSSQNITGLVVMAQIAIANGQPFSEPFTLADNSVVTLSGPGMIGMGVAVGQYVAAVYARGRALRDEINATTTAADLAAIDLNAGWP